jgi:hypothetical protein
VAGTTGETRHMALQIRWSPRYVAPPMESWGVFWLETKLRKPHQALVREVGYEIARELVAKGAKAQARDHLELLWNDAPAFGDPAKLGAQVGFTYEEFQRGVEKQAEDAKKELEEAQQQLEAAEAERMTSLIAWERKTRRQRFRHDILGDGYLTIVLSCVSFFVCLVIALCVLANQASFASDARLPFHLSQLIFVAVIVVPASIVLYFIVFSPTLPIVAFLAVMVASLGLGELLLQVNWSVANPVVHVFTLPLLGSSTASPGAILFLLLFSALASTIAALIAGLPIGIGLYVLKITHGMKSSIGLSLLYSVIVTVSYVIVANVIGAILGDTVAGLVIGTITALAVVVIRIKDSDTTLFLIILLAGIVLSLFIRFVESPLFGLSDLSANWLALSLIYGLLFGYGAGKIFRSSVLAARYLQHLRHRKREGFDALTLLRAFRNLGNGVGFSWSGLIPAPRRRPVTLAIAADQSPIPPPSYHPRPTRALHLDALTLVGRLHLLALCRVAVHLAQQRCPPPLPTGPGGAPRVYREESLLLLALLRTRLPPVVSGTARLVGRVARLGPCMWVTLGARWAAASAQQSAAIQARPGSRGAGE